MWPQVTSAVLTEQEKGAFQGQAWGRPHRKTPHRAKFQEFRPEECDTVGTVLLNVFVATVRNTQEGEETFSEQGQLPDSSHPDRGKWLSCPGLHWPRWGRLNPYCSMLKV